MSYLDSSLDHQKLDSTGAVLLAGGLGLRMGSILKPFIDLRGRWVLDYSVEAFSRVKAIEKICIVAPVELHQTILKRYANKSICCAKPGSLRQESLYNGLLALDRHLSYVIVHDAARPLVTTDIILDVLSATQRQGAALCAISITSTIKKSKEALLVETTVPRNELWEAQTPQAAERELFEQAFLKVHKEHIEVTDDVQLIELLGQPIAIVKGNKENIKITTKQDLSLAAFYLEQRDL